MSPKHRDSMLIGIHSVDSALSRVPGQLRSITIAQECRNPRVLELGDRARAAGIDVLTEARTVIDRRCDEQRHQDVIADFEAANIGTEKDLERILDARDSSPLLLILDGVQDPHNFGACLRTAEAAGVDLVILPKDRSASLTPVARRSASGAAEVLPILFVTNLARVLRQLKDRGIWLAGTADSSGQELYQADLSGPLGLVMGSEGKGMRRLTAELCDFHLRIPMQGSVSSLNVSVATGVCLYEAIRQRSMK
jgi:23S rRNA (guanosine2251-2'-O)-methyltransferase